MRYNRFFYKLQYFLLCIISIALFYFCISLNLLFSQEKLDLNKATLEQLKALPGIGEITAKRIIELRERKGGFQSIEELKDVPGIGDKKLEVLKNYLTVKEEVKNIFQESSNNTKMESSRYDNTRVIYMYKDDKGNLHYTQFPELVPEKFRKSLKPIR